MYDLASSQPTHELLDPPDQRLSVKENSDPFDLTSVLLHQQSRTVRQRRVLLDVTQMCVSSLGKAKFSTQHHPHGSQLPSPEASKPNCRGSGGAERESGAVPECLEEGQIEDVLSQWMRGPKCRATIAASIQRFLSKSTQSNSFKISELPCKSSPYSESLASRSAAAKLKPIIMIDVTSMLSCTKYSPCEAFSSTSGHHVGDVPTQVEFSSAEDHPALSPLFPPKEATIEFLSQASQQEQHGFLETSWNAAQKELAIEKGKVERLKTELSCALEQCEELRCKLEQAQYALLEQKHTQECEASREREELRRLRILMRFSELKKDSDRLPDVLANLQEVTQQRASLERQNTRLRARHKDLRRCIEMVQTWTAKAALTVESGGCHEQDAACWARFGPSIVSRIHELCVETLDGRRPQMEENYGSLYAAPQPSGAGHVRRVCRSVLVARRASMSSAPPRDTATELISENEGNAISVKKAPAVSVLRETRARPELVRPRPCSEMPRSRVGARPHSACMKW